VILKAVLIKDYSLVQEFQKAGRGIYIQMLYWQYFGKRTKRRDSSVTSVCISPIFRMYRRLQWFMLGRPRS